MEGRGERKERRIVGVFDVRKYGLDVGVNKSGDLLIQGVTRKNNGVTQLSVGHSKIIMRAVTTTVQG